MKHRPGQTLVLLIVFVAVAVTVATAAVVLVISNSQNSSRFQLGSETLYIAESGAENGLMRLLRDPAYAGETLPVGDGQVVVTVTGSGPFTLDAVGTLQQYSSHIRVIAGYTGGILTVTSWQEVSP